MDRRDFLRLSSLAGLTLATPLSVKAFSDFGVAQNDFPYFIVNVVAAGGWDTSCLCDPKGGNYITDAGEDKGPINRAYGEGDILSAGNINYAPMMSQDVFGDRRYSNERFFSKYFKDLLVINGIDMDTFNHETGSELAWAGREARAYPTIPALYAAASQENRALAYLSYGGYDKTRDLVSVSRINNLDKLDALAHPNMLGDNTIHSHDTYLRIKKAMQRRLERLAGVASVPRSQQAIASLQGAQMGAGQLGLLEQYLPGDLDPDNDPNTQAKVIAAAFKAGLCHGANIYRGGFDTHNSHDGNHSTRLLELLYAVDTLMEEAQRHGIADRVLVIMGSEFSRTPYYNDTEGKDHWNSNSFMVLGHGIQGNRVVGETDAQVKPVAVPTNRPVLTTESMIHTDIIGIHDVHASLRTHLGIDGFASNYPLDTPKFDFFA